LFEYRSAKFCDPSREARPSSERVIKVELSLEALFASGCKRWPKLRLQFTQVYFKKAGSGDRERLTQSPKSDASREV
jgi:hypothetical protein